MFIFAEKGKASQLKSRFESLANENQQTRQVPNFKHSYSIEWLW